LRGGGDDNGNPDTQTQGEQTYTVTPSVSNSGGGGAISPSAPVSVKPGSTVTFTLTPSSGYSLSSIGGSCNGTLSGAIYTVQTAATDCTVVAIFTPDVQTYAVTPSVSGSGGSISPASAVSVESGKTAEFTLRPDSGYTLSDVGGTCGGTLSGTTYVTSAIANGCTVVATFALAEMPDSQTHTVTPSVSGAGGAISPSGVVAVKSGATATFTLTPNPGYIVSSVGGTCGGTFNGAVYTTTAIAADCTVVAAFATGGRGALTFSYKTQPRSTEKISADDFLALLNQEGAKGYFLYTDSYNSDFGWIFVNDGSGQTYSYELLFYKINQADFMIQVNGEGGKGYRFDTALFAPFLLPPSEDGNSNIIYSLYRKDSGSSAQYTYTTDLIPDNAEDFIAQLNKWGGAGYLFSFTDAPFGSNLYVKNTASKATYAYDAPVGPITVSDFVAQLNSQGAKGYRALYKNRNGGMIYVKDETQAATFAYQANITIPTIDKMNSYGTQGYAYLGWIPLDHTYYDSATGEYKPASGPAAGYYVSASNCSGWMCTALSPAVGDSKGPMISLPLSPSGVAVN
jgi:hypothetical protein